MDAETENRINRIFRTLEFEIEDLIDAAKSDIIAALECEPKSQREAALQGKAVSDFQWVARATGTDWNRPNLHFIRARNGIIEATNGHILLWCDSEMEDGLYTITGEREIADNIKFPDVDKVKPSWDNWQPLVIGKQDKERAQINGVSVVDKKYLNLITEGSPEEWEIAFSDKSTNKPLSLRHKTSSRRAVLMPRRDEVKE